ncbi:hypothetical protein [Aeromonas salmonicida]|uniref:hypothetical protein n=1 Tax=Aeromonas salmonicida TaxID=645 RepID=UPI0024A996FF|nr:hypothetical protein [Aeromonas salmonicida]WHF42162.1 hypothetical protein QJ050_05125 [Aeromonas salmonicida]
MSETVTTSQQELAGKYKPYPEYKDSGLEWLGEIPAHWNISRIKYVAQLNPSKSEVRGLSDDTIVSFIPMEAIGERGEIDVSRTRLLGDVLTGYSYITDGDVILAKITPCFENGKGAVVHGLENGIGFATTEVIPARPYRKCDAQFLYYLFTSNPFKALAEGSMYGAGGQKRVADSFVAEYHFAEAPTDERENIAAFLDYETAQIDRLIAHQQRLIELLKEKRQALISHAVRTRPGEGHIKLAYAINLLTGYPFASSGFKSAKDTHIPLLRGANVGVDQIKWDDVVYWDSEDCSHLDDYYLECGDIVFGMDRPWISSGARVAEITQHDTPCLLLQRVARIRAKANHFQTYIKLCLSSNEFRNYVEADLTGVSVPHISPDQIKGFLIRNLPYDEQVSVTKEVLQALEKLNAVERAAFNAIELLQERRTALISAAVTGKIDLRGWEPPAEEVAA